MKDTNTEEVVIERKVYESLFVKQLQFFIKNIIDQNEIGGLHELTSKLTNVYQTYLKCNLRKFQSSFSHKEKYTGIKEKYRLHQVKFFV